MHFYFESDKNPENSMITFNDNSVLETFDKEENKIIRRVESSLIMSHETLSSISEWLNDILKED